MGGRFWYIFRKSNWESRVFLPGWGLRYECFTNSELWRCGKPAYLDHSPVFWGHVHFWCLCVPSDVMRTRRCVAVFLLFAWNTKKHCLTHGRRWLSRIFITKSGGGGSTETNKAVHFEWIWIRFIQVKEVHAKSAQVPWERSRTNQLTTQFDTKPNKSIEFPPIRIQETKSWVPTFLYQKILGSLAS